MRADAPAHRGALAAAMAMRSNSFCRFGAKSLGFAEVNAAWREALKDEHLRTLGRWCALPDSAVGKHLAGVAALATWWEVVSRACPLVASPVAERAIGEVRGHFARLLALNPIALPLETSGQLLRLAQALSAQATQSEHAYLVSEQELAWARSLKGAVVDADAIGAPAWRPLTEALLPAFPSPSQDGGSHDTGQLPPGERRDDTVQAFYERHPFPQWVDLTPWERPELLAYPLRDAGKPGRSVLVAGCGTARWACHFAATFPGASVLGVDVSRRSLAYAEERRRSFGLGNLTLEHADLRSWVPAPPGRRFDFIECGGVLHHLEDAGSAWARLADLLSPGGVMLVSLYSRAARKPLKELKREILGGHKPAAAAGAAEQAEEAAAAPPAPDDEALRRFRQELLMKTWTSERFMQLARSPDFHSLSRLRDVFFHPLEHEYDLLELQRLLDGLGLRPLGFDDRDASNLFQRHKPGKKLYDLGAWHELEQEVPELFLSMYELFVAKK